MFWFVTSGVNVKDLKFSDSKTLLFPSKTNPEEEERQKVIFLCESIKLKNCDEKEVLDLPNPTMPLASLDKPFNKRVFEQVNKNSWVGLKIESFFDSTATTSSTRFPFVATLPVMVFLGKFSQG
jgi:hypothetical protein